MEKTFKQRPEGSKGASLTAKKTSYIICRAQNKKKMWGPYPQLLKTLRW